jgi:hypothetical protein
MTPDKLQVGDIIFFMDASTIPIHVAIYAGMRNNTHYITHAVTGSYHSIITTRLKSDDFPYKVFRCKDMVLATQSALRMRSWEEHRVPFSIEKHDLHSVISEDQFGHPKTGGTDQLSLAIQYFAPNYYRYIEYAAHPEMPYFPKGKNMKGMYCSEAITAAFNVQKLLMLNTIKPNMKGWVSDHTSTAIFSNLFTKLFGNKIISDRYQAYLDSIRSKTPYPYGVMPSNTNLEQAPFLPSLSAWAKEEYSSEEFVDNLLKESQFELPLDSVIATPRAMMAHMEKDSEHWENCGELTLEITANPLDALETRSPEVWRAHVAKLFAVAEKKQESLVSAYTTIDPLNINWRPASAVKSLVRSRSFDDTCKMPHPVVSDLLSVTNKYKSVSFFVTPERQKPAKDATHSINNSKFKGRTLFNESNGKPPKHPDSIPDIALETKL